MLTFHSIGRPNMGLSTWQHKGEWNLMRGTRNKSDIYVSELTWRTELIPSVWWWLKIIFDRLSAYLYNFTQNETYFTSAHSAYQFIQSHLYDSTTHSLQYKIYLFDCTYQDKPPFASDVGLYLEALTVLSEATNDEAMRRLLVSHKVYILFGLIKRRF